jgi:hypothetical protein
MPPMPPRITPLHNLNPLMFQNANLHVGSSVQVFTLNAHRQMLNGGMP